MDRDRGGWHRDEEGGGDRVKAEMGQHGMGQAEEAEEPQAVMPTPPPA